MVTSVFAESAGVMPVLTNPTFLSPHPYVCCNKLTGALVQSTFHARFHVSEPSRPHARGLACVDSCKKLIHYGGSHR